MYGSDAGGRKEPEVIAYLMAVCSQPTYNSS